MHLVYSNNTLYITWQVTLYKPLTYAGMMSRINNFTLNIHE